MQKFTVLILLMTFLSCSTNQAKTDKTLTDTVGAITFPIKPLFVDDGDEEGWGADIRLSITEIIPSDSFTTYKAVSSYKGKNIGLEISLPNGGPENEKALAQILLIRSDGEVSNNLLSTLSELYKQKVDTAKQFIDSAKVAFIDLNEFAKSLGQEPTQKRQNKEMKIFFEAENPDDNAELYLNINENEHWLELREKDEGYRDQVIKFLTRK